MHTTGMSFKAIGRQMGYHYAVVNRLVRKHTQTNNVKDLPRSGRPRVTSDRDDRALQSLVRRMPFAISPVLKQHWLPNRRLSTRIRWSDESRFLLHVTNGRMRVWKHKNTASTPRNIQPTVPYGGGSVMVWGVSLMTACWI